MPKKEITHVNLKEIKNPDFVKEMSYKELDVLSADIRDYILECTSKNGGHISSNLGVVEATISLCRNFDFSKDKIIFDVGHQSYTYKILTGRSLENLRRKDGVSGFQKISESPYDHFEAGHSSTSISASLGMAVARDLDKKDYNIIAFIGDSSVSNGLAFEGLNNLASSGHKVIIVINDNNMSISKPVGGLAKFFRNFSTSGIYLKSKNALNKVFRKTRFGRWILRGFARFKNWFKRKVLSLTLFDSLGFSMIGPIDGHHFRSMDNAFKKAKRIDKPVVVYLKTVKGKGYPYAENDETGNWHGVGNFNVTTGEISIKDATVSWSEQYKNILKNEMKNNDKIITIVPATGHGSSIDSLFEMFPKRTLDVGIAEEHALTLAGGLSISGYHPVVFIYSTFLQRAYDELSHDVARMNLNATILIDRAGLVGGDGDTHQGIYDEAFLYTIPNVTITMASRTNESLSLMKESLCNHGVFAIRLPRENILDGGQEVHKIPYGSWKEELKGSKTAIVSTGPITLELKKLLIEQHKNVTLYNAIYLKPMDENKIKNLLSYDRIIIYDSYATKEGFVNALESRLLELGYKGEVISKCVPTVFVKQASISEQRKEFKLTPEDIIELL